MAESTLAVEIARTAARLAQLTAEWVEEQERRAADSNLRQLPRNLSATEAAHILGVHPATVRLMVKRGTIPHVKIGSRIGIPEDRLAEWMRTERVGGSRGGRKRAG